MPFTLSSLLEFTRTFLSQVHWILVVLGVFVGYQASRLMVSYVAPIGFYDEPSSDRTNSTHRVPRTGGLAFMASLFVCHQFGVITLPFFNTLIWGLLGFMGILGLADDFSRRQPIAFITAGFKSRYTLIVASIAGLGLLWPLQEPLDGLLTNFLSASKDFQFSPQFYLSTAMNFAFFGYPIPSFYPLIFVGIALLCWGMPNLFNLIDGIDGLAMGYFGMALFVVMRMPNGDLVPGPAFWGLWAVVFYLNLKRIHFLGDAGSLSMGLFLALTSVLYISSLHIEHFFFLFAYPILDSLHVVLLRFKQNRPMGQGDNCHLHHFMLRQTKKNLCWTLPILWILAFLPMLRLWGSPIYQSISLVGIVLLIVILCLSFVIQLNEKTIPVIKS